MLAEVSLLLHRRSLASSHVRDTTEFSDVFTEKDIFRFIFLQILFSPSVIENIHMFSGAAHELNIRALSSA